jgi:hypothetical protein
MRCEYLECLPSTQQFGSIKRARCPGKDCHQVEAVRTRSTLQRHLSPTVLYFGLFAVETDSELFK